MAGAPPIADGMGESADASSAGECEVEWYGVDFKQAGIRRHVDHIVPAPLIRRLNAGNPDHPDIWGLFSQAASE